MSTDRFWAARARRPRGDAGAIRRDSSAEQLEPYLQDAAHYPGGHCREVCFPSSEAEVAALLRGTEPVLAVGAQSSLTGGATPQGGIVLSTAGLRSVHSGSGWSAGSVRIGPGLVLSELEAELAARDLYYPPVPTYDGATVGGTIATNAAGAATFKYGSTRDWVAGLTVVLAGGDVLDLERGRTLASAEGHFEIARTDGSTTRVEVPGYTMPPVAKRSAGYFACQGMDLIDLFIGAEGTLGVVTEIELRLVRPRPAWFAALVPLADDRAAIELTAALREASLATREAADRDGIDVAAVEYMDARCLELLREDAADERLGIALPGEAGAAVLLQAELEPSTTRAQAFDQLSRLDLAGNDSALARLGRLLAEHGVLDAIVPALPGENARRAALFALREAVPEAVNRRVRDAQRTIDPSISKSGGDVIVPFDRFAQALERYRRIIEERGLEHAIWGHISDGNVHPNILAASAEQMESARQAQLEIGEAAISMDGCPMSEHGVGRNPTKQQLLERLYGPDGLRAMKAVKAALDPDGILAPGVLFK